MVIVGVVMTILRDMFNFAWVVLHCVGNMSMFLLSNPLSATQFLDAIEISSCKAHRRLPFGYFFSSCLTTGGSGESAQLIFKVPVVDVFTPELFSELMQQMKAGCFQLSFRLVQAGDESTEVMAHCITK